MWGSVKYIDAAVPLEQFKVNHEDTEIPIR